MKTYCSQGISILLIMLLICTFGCADKGFQWQGEAHAKELDRKKGYKQKNHRVNYHRYNQHHSKHRR